MLTSKQWRRAGLWLALIASLLLLGYQVSHASSAILSPEDDFVEYWAASRLLLSGNNPYSPEQMLALQQAVGRPRDYPLMMYNPPWALAAVLWSGFLSYSAARSTWLLLMLVIILFSADLAWRHYGGLQRHRWIAALLALTFVPALISLNIGQIGPLVLLGLVGFLHFSRRSQWGWAGVCLALASIKPQLLYLLWGALLLWFITQWQWRLILGGALALVAALLVPLALFPELINRYIELVLYYPPVGWAPPTPGSALRVWFGVEKGWLQWAPALLGILWLLYYWRQRYDKWDWSETMSPILLVAVMAAVYAWVHDQTILILVMVQVAARLSARWAGPNVAGHNGQQDIGWISRMHTPFIHATALYLLINGLILLVQVTGAGGIIELWTAFAWPLLYLFVQHDGYVRYEASK